MGDTYTGPINDAERREFEEMRKRVADAQAKRDAIPSPLEPDQEMSAARLVPWALGEAAGRFAAPARSAVGAVLDGRGAKGAFNAAAEQIVRENKYAPTGEEINEKLGLKLPDSPTGNTNLTGISPKKVAGLVTEMAVDPVVGYGVAKKGLMGGAALLMETQSGQAAAEAIGKAISKVPVLNKAKNLLPGSVLAKAGNMLTGVPTRAIKTYGSEMGAIEEMATKYADPRGGGVDTLAAVNDWRDSVLQEIRSLKESQNQIINSAVQSIPATATADASPVMKSLEKARRELDPDLHAGAIREIDDLIATVKTKISSDPLLGTNEIPLRDLQRVKQYLMKRAEPAYLQSGQIFNSSPVSQRAAKSAAREARIIMDAHGPAELKTANGRLWDLHRIDENPAVDAVLDPNKRITSLISAGSGTNRQTEKVVEEIGGLLGRDLRPDVDRLAALHYFGDPNMMALSSGGTTSTSRSLIAAPLAAVAAAKGGPVAATGAALIAGAATSPMALKRIIQAGKAPTALTRLVTGGSTNKISDAAIALLWESLKTPTGRAALDAYLKEGGTEEKAQPGSPRPAPGPIPLPVPDIANRPQSTLDSMKRRFSK